jgi:hypothetical protein
VRTPISHPLGYRHNSSITTVAALQLQAKLLLELLQTRLDVRLSHLTTGRANAKAKDVSETSFLKLSLSIKYLYNM